MASSRKTLAFVLAAGVSAAAVAGVATVRSPADAQTAAPAAPVAEVDVAAVLSKPVVDWQSYSGRLEAVDHVEVRPRVSGTIVAVHFRNGALVKQGEPLFTIDPRPYAAEVERAEAQVAAAEARVRYTAADLERARSLVRGDTISRRTLDDRENAAREAAANLKAAQAALELARIDLGHTRVVAPVSGRVSRAERTVGNVVAAGAAAEPLTTLVSVSPIYASFDVDEQTYLRHIAPVKDATAVPVQLGLADEEGYSRTGAVEHVDNHLDTVSGTIRVRARFDNPDGTLIPGLYARVKVGAAKPRDALLVEDRAVGTDQDKKFVYVVGADDTVRYRPVTLGPAQDGLRVVTDGLTAGDRVIVNGLQHARPGMAVRPNMVAMGGRAQADKTQTAAASPR